MRAFLGTIALLSALSGAATDARFGLTGTGGRVFAEKFGLTYYALEGNYTRAGVFSSTDSANDPTGGRKVLRKVAKLNVRLDTLGQTNAQFQAALGDYATALTAWHATRVGPKPAFAWYNPSATALAAAESLQIVATIAREKTRNPAVTGTVWEIGNEPNLFPAIRPADYGALFNRYYAIIKRADPAARVALGPLFVRETALDLLPRMREILTQSLVAKGLGQPGQPLFDSVNNDLWAAYSSRTLALGTAEYLDQVLAVLDTAVHPEIGSLHVYPFDDRLPALTTAAIKTTLDSLADTLTARLRKRNSSAVLWVTEFGNINDGFSEDQAAAQASSLLDVFTANAGFQNWFYYKATGYDTQLLGLPGLATPLTRLAADSAFAPADGNFACGRLNAIGRMYYLRANGTACSDPQAGFTFRNSVYSVWGKGPNDSIPVRLSRKSADTVRVQVAFLEGGFAEGTNFTLPSHTVVFAPGDTLEPVAVTNIRFTSAASPTATFVLRSPEFGELSPDSLHTLTLDFTDAVLGGGLPPGLSLWIDPLRAALVVVTPEALTVRLRILDAAGRVQGTLRPRLETGRNVVDLRTRSDRSGPGSGNYRLEVSGPGFRRVLPFPWIHP